MHTCEEYSWFQGSHAVPSWGVRIAQAWLAYDGVRFSTRSLDNQGFHAVFSAKRSLRAGQAFLREPPARHTPWNSGGV